MQGIEKGKVVPAHITEGNGGGGTAASLLNLET
jgi:hypothetical protein